MEKEAEYKTNGSVNQGENVRRLRQILGIKQSDLANQVGLSQQMMSYLEQSKVIEEKYLMKIAEVLKVSPKSIQEMDDSALSVDIENNFENNTFENKEGEINIGSQGINYGVKNIHPLDKLVDLTNDSIAIYKQMIDVEREKSALLEKMLKEKE